MDEYRAKLKAEGEIAAVERARVREQLKKDSAKQEAENAQRAVEREQLKVDSAKQEIEFAARNTPEKIKARSEAMKTESNRHIVETFKGKTMYASRFAFNYLSGEPVQYVSHTLTEVPTDMQYKRHRKATEGVRANLKFRQKGKVIESEYFLDFELQDDDTVKLTKGSFVDDTADDPIFVAGDPIKGFRNDAKAVKAIQTRSLYVGMPEDVLYAVRGKPVTVNTTKTARGESLQLVYGSGRYVYMRKGRVDSWQDSE